jgi:DNA primase
MYPQNDYDLKERVKQAIDIADLVGSYVQLRREGRGYKALCPWHDDSKPSLQVNPERQSFKCWVCDIGGDVFSFMMKIENIEFREALQMLADRAGISRQTLASNDRSNAPPGSADDKRSLYAAMAWAVDLYHRYLLEAPQAEIARKYLAERQVSADSIRKFKLGFAPNEWEWLAAKARNQFSAAVLEKVNLIGRKRNGSGFYDPFKGRVLFPIFDAQSRPVALGGRVMPELAPDDPRKYVNSAETPLFTKSKMLYGLNAARDSIRKTQQALVMEGYTDCIMAHQHGFENAVAVLGTALGAEHIQLLRRFEDRVQIVSVLDGDEAGRKRANEVLELFVAANADLRILTLPDDLDPCEFLLGRGSQQFAQRIEGAADALHHAFRVATASVDLDRDIQGATRALEQLLGIIAKAPRLRSDTTVDHRLREEKFLQRLARDFRVREEQLRDRLSDLRRKNGSRTQNIRETASKVSPPAAGSGTAEKLEPCEQEMLELLLLSPEFFARFEDAVRPEQVRHPHTRAIMQKCRQLALSGILPDFQRLLLEFEDELIKTMLVQLDERARLRRSGDLETRLKDVLSHFQNRELRSTALQEVKSIQEGRLGANEELAALLKIHEQHRNRLGISASTDG